MTDFSRQEIQIIDLIAEGYDREGIALYMDMSDSVVRTVIRRMCESYKCSTRELPGLLRGTSSENSMRGVDR